MTRITTAAILCVVVDDVLLDQYQNDLLFLLACHSSCSGCLLVVLVLLLGHGGHVLISSYAKRNPGLRIVGEKCYTLLLLGDHDDNITTQAPAQVHIASNMPTTKFGYERANPAEDICSPADQHEDHENVRVAAVTQNQHAAKGRGGSQDHDQICTKNYGQGGHPKRANEKLGREFERTNQKQGKDIKRTNQTPMTYREALLGLDKSEQGSDDNSEPSSDF